ncbi:MAG: hypothetical protein ABI461_23160, partial [Polyangiaceae bacterium]
MALWGLALVALSAVFAAWMWGFTIDDAFISIRYARHLASGNGYRFNSDGPTTDGVTPLPWPFVLAPFAHASALAVLMRAKCINLVAWLSAAFFLGKRIGSVDTKPIWRAAAVAVVAIDLPVIAGAVSGMETGIATALATFAALEADRNRVYSAAILAGISAAFRPEMAPWALAIALGLTITSPDRKSSDDSEAPRSASSRDPQVIALALLFAIGPFAFCALVRFAVFGHLAPLAVLAKPSDLTHGAVYAVAAALVSLTFVLAFAPLAIARASRSARILAVAGLVHFLAIAVAGGDWMPYARLAAPVAPSLALVFIRSAPFAKWWSAALRIVLAAGLGIRMLISAAPAGRHVERDREALIQASRDYLQNAHIVASADIGWPTAATEAHIVDLAGLTDPNIAALGGGHTSKRIDPAMVIDAHADVVLLYATAGIGSASLDDWRSAEYEKLVDVRL